MTNLRNQIEYRNNARNKEQKDESEKIIIKIIWIKMSWIRHGRLEPTFFIQNKNNYLLIVFELRSTMGQSLNKIQ